MINSPSWVIFPRIGCLIASSGGGRKKIKKCRKDWDRAAWLRMRKGGGMTGRTSAVEGKEGEVWKAG